MLVSMAILVAVYAQQPPVAILRQASDSSPDGAYSYNYEAENGISVNEQGRLGPAGEEGQAVVVQGSYQYVGPDGVTYEVKYVADENGFQPQGAHLPVAPEVPEAIQRSIQFNAAHPEPEQRNQQQYRRF
ncbi:hypothetical protein HCN44_003912 [Aphidius gifuensis]|uniref:Cuticular protein n=1 Tax=Aphidius gifuensis TaxID=684658 RepID=A0A834XVY8_APHGI|nr:hypothetical protein HCN44_003912 [Aphidius gifuensis]